MTPVGAAQIEPNSLFSKELEQFYTRWRSLGSSGDLCYKNVSADFLTHDAFGHASVGSIITAVLLHQPIH